jgi:hypothetical protein
MSSVSSVGRREVLIINPTNISDGKFSDRNGLNQIIFEIPRASKVLNGKSLRISGTMTLKNGAGDSPENGKNFYGNSTTQTDPPEKDFFIDGRTSLHSSIETLSIQNLEGATYSTIKNYNRLVSSILPLANSVYDYQNGEDLASGGLGKDSLTARKCDNSFDFCIPLYEGLLQGQPLDLMLVKGLKIVITLSSSNYVIHNNYWRNIASSSATASGGAYYELSDVLLTTETEVPPADQQEAMMENKNGIFEYETYTNMYNVLQSTDHSVSLNINTSRTLGVIGNMIPSEWINNYKYNSSQTLQPLAENGNQILDNRIVVDLATYTRGSLRQPLDFEVKSEKPQEEGVADSGKNWEELNVLTREWLVSSLTKSLQTELSNPLSNIQQARYSRTRQAIVDEDKRQQYNIGVGMDWITENGMNYKGVPFGTRIKLKFTNNEKLDPHSIFFFVKHKNTIEFNNGMVNVLN